MTSPLDLERLEEIARAATPGPWQNGIDDLEGVVAPDNPGLGNVICIPPTKKMYSSLEHWTDNAAHIATFNPPTVLRLISLLKEQEAEIGRLREALEPFAKAARMLRFDPPQVMWETEANGLVYAWDHDGKIRFTYDTLSADDLINAVSALSPLPLPPAGKGE